MSKSDRRGELRDVDVEAISLVNKAANGEKFKIYKSADEVPEVVTKDERGLFSILKKFFTGEDADVSKGAVADVVNSSKHGEKLAEAFGALLKVLGLSRWSDDKQTPETDPVKITAAINDFRDLAIEIMLGQQVEKSGRKISNARLAKLKSIETLISEILSDVNDQSEGEESVTKEDVAKTVEDAIKPFAERIEKLEKSEEAPVPKEEPQNANQEEIQKAVDDAIAPLMERLEKVEKARGVSNKVPEDTSDKKSEDNFWGSIF